MLYDVSNECRISWSFDRVKSLWDMHTATDREETFDTINPKYIHILRLVSRRFIMLGKEFAIIFRYKVVLTKVA